MQAYTQLELNFKKFCAIQSTENNLSECDKLWKQRETNQF